MMNSHTIFTMLILVLNMMFCTCRYMLQDNFGDALMNKNCIFRNIAESLTVAPDSL